MIQIKQLVKKYSSRQGQVVALDHVNLHISPGSIYGIIGLSGAGKSTLVRCLNLLEKPSGGEIIVAGQNLTALSSKELRKARQNIGMIFQHFYLLQSRTVAENIAFPLEIAGTPKKEISQRVKELLHLVGLEDKAAAYPAQLSGGQKQRVGIARALATKPQVLLCDEATSALDPQTTLSILNLLRDINQKLGLTIVMITHEMKVIKEICTDIAVIHEAHIVENGPVESVFIKPQSDIARQFISTIFPNELPEDLLKELATHRDSEIVRIQFLGSRASDPIITDLLRTCDVRANILYGSIDHLRSTLFGTLTLELQGSPDQLQEARRYLASRDLNVEVVQSGLG
ncbi:ABC-type metal ion transport system, ATPase component [Desulfosporosinus orientis DSM 765]|uniref:ABC-type metal ion transport system, ATPase component n=1 Tax=Desulfosporosinus orientis (strain ATCC 19365 / DSM 765 / NCIMB 8382 / VKM B-1628 / Singapore I) TaxID=768706 RepID=G7W7Z0_DESOD|nr:methionine ABC transporter ATP-binding protein [Desulfosporosinus orientis]AET66416.1 ABC-type metal ion transport system, ATPase component [Desulfosporosinus orientis DSM 765]